MHPRKAAGLCGGALVGEFERGGLVLRENQLMRSDRASAPEPRSSTGAVHAAGSAASRRCGRECRRAQAWGSTSLSLAVPIRAYIADALRPPWSRPQNSHDFRPGAIRRSFYPSRAGLLHPLSLACAVQPACRNSGTHASDRQTIYPVLRHIGIAGFRSDEHRVSGPEAR